MRVFLLGRYMAPVSALIHFLFTFVFSLVDALAQRHEVPGNVPAVKAQSHQLACWNQVSKHRVRIPGQGTLVGCRVTAT